MRIIEWQNSNSHIVLKLEVLFSMSSEQPATTEDDAQMSDDTRADVTAILIVFAAALLMAVHFISG